MADILSEFPDVFGVFLFASHDLDVLYIGQAVHCGLGRAALAARDSNGTAEGATHATWLATDSAERAAVLTAELVSKYGPKNNR